MPLSRPRRRKKYKLKPQWEVLLKTRIDAVAAVGGLFGFPKKSKRSKVYEDSIGDALRTGDVTLESLLSSSEIHASSGTKRKWARIEALRGA